MDLGVVPYSVAVKGVEVTASIAPGHSITFQFQPESAGTYELFVRHTGEGFTLNAKGPSGSASIDPGPAGPFETLILPLSKSTYDITAAATGSDPVFVDWELLLVSGAGQAPAAATSLVSSSASVPLAVPSAPAGVSTFAPTTSAPVSVASAVPASVSIAAPVSTASAIVYGGPVGRSEVDQPISPVGPTTQGGSYSVAFDGAGLPQGLFAIESSDANLAKTSISVASIPVTRGVSEDVALIDSISTSDPWWRRIALAILPEGPAEGPVAEEMIEPIVVADAEVPDSTGESHVSADAMPGMAVGLVGAVVIVRRRAANNSRQTPRKKQGFFLSRSDWPRSFAS